MTRRRDIDVSSGSATLRWPCSQAVAVNGMVFLAGQTGGRGTSVGEQAAEAHNAFSASRWPATTTVITGRNGGPELEVEVIAVPGAAA
jgi:hypothetical protein